MRCQTWRTGLLDSSETATAVSPELSRNQTALMELSARMSLPIDTSRTVSGWTPATKKNTWAAAQSDKGGPVALNSRRPVPYWRRHDVAAQSMAVPTVAAAGPKRTASARQNVSETEMRTSTPGILSPYAPASTPADASSNHSVVRGVPGSAQSDVAMTPMPAAATNATYQPS